MHNLGKESYHFDRTQGSRFVDLERRQMIHEALSARRPFRSRINHLFHILNHARRIRIEVKIDYQEVRPEATSARSA